MYDRIYYVICEDNCKFEGMTKEQIMAAIEQAVETGEIKDVDSGFVTTIKEINHQRGLRFWVGTTAEFNALPAKQNNVLYIKSDDTSEQDILNQFEKLNQLESVFSKANVTRMHINVSANSVECPVLAWTALGLTAEEASEITGNPENMYKYFALVNLENVTGQMVSVSTVVSVSGVGIQIINHSDTDKTVYCKLTLLRLNNPTINNIN